MIIVRFSITAAALALIVSAGDVPAASPAKPAKPRLLDDARSQRNAPALASYEEKVVPLLSKYCYDCHGRGKRKGDFALDVYPDLKAVTADPRAWEKVMQNLRTEVMPPAKKPKPTPAENKLIADWIEQAVFHCDCDHPDPGRVTVRRLNRAEYNNTIRDLVGIDFRPADDFPADDSGYGFDNIGDVLSVPPILLEKYLSAAEAVMEKAIVTEDPARQRRRRFAADALPGTAPGDPVDGGARMLAREGDIQVDFPFSRPGEYALRARAYGQQAGDQPTRMRLALGTNTLSTFDVLATDGSATNCEIRVRVAAGTNRFSAAYINNFVDRKKGLDRNLFIEFLEIEGPLDAPPDPLPSSHTRIFFRGRTATNDDAYASSILERFVARAYRRPARTGEVERLAGFARQARQQGETFERSLQLALSAVLVSPHFLFRGEPHPEPGNPRAAYRIDEFALASRLSYFLWSSLPDDELSQLASQGRLRRQLDRQVRRMLADPKSRALVDNFAGQWLQLRNMRI
uniref:DUF1587 domain-containing protein n=1 Tax=uncultured Phenylobacterium sp. TaxID=349273 RepID=UPI0025D0C5B6